MIALWISLGVVGLLLIVFIVVIFFIHNIIFYSPKKGQNNDFQLTESTQFLGLTDIINKLITDICSEPCEHVYTTSYDHKILHSRLYRNPNSKKVIIMFHGYRGTARRDFSGFGMYMIKKGYNVLLVDERGHGESKGHSITFGYKEKRDVLSWVSFAKKELGNDIELTLAGISMGAASILFASQYIDEPVKLICDCPFNTSSEVLVSFMKKLKLKVWLIWPLTKLSSLLISHASLTKDNASKALKNSKAKVLIIHGDDDHVINHKFSYQIYLDNKEKVRYELFPKTDHGVSFMTDTERYKKVVDEFLE